MSKILINGKELPPAKKIKLDKYMKRTEIQKLIKQKQEELENEQSSGN